MESGTHDELMEIEDGVYGKMIKAQEIAKGEEDTTLDGRSCSFWGDTSVDFC